MKKISILITGFLLFICFLTTKAFSQPVPGGEGTDHGISQPSPVSFKRNNGNDICGSAAEIRVSFNELPDYFPAIAQIRSEQRDITGVIIDNIDSSQLASKGYVSYCIRSSNIIPAVKLWIRFHYEKSNQDYWLTESLNPQGR